MAKRELSLLNPVGEFNAGDRDRRVRERLQQQGMDTRHIRTAGAHL